MTLNKIPNENLVTSEPIQPLHHQFMHMNEDTRHMKQSPLSIHALSESRLQRDLEDSSSESEDFNQEGGRDVCVTKAISLRPRRRPVQPRDVWNDRGLRYYVQFNEFNQPLRKGGGILVSFLEDVAKRETFCPVGVSSWHKLKKKIKVDIVILVRENYFDPMTRIDDKNYDNRPDGISKRIGQIWSIIGIHQNFSYSSKSRIEIENEVFNDLMYNGLLRKEGSSYVNHSAYEMENLKNAFSAIKKQNEDLQQKNQALESKINDMAQSSKVITSHLAQVLKEVRNGNVRHIFWTSQNQQ
ncbi:Glutamate-1-semialdehyde 2 1-aminomutase [Bienertia sinuspersici]